MVRYSFGFFMVLICMVMGLGMPGDGVSPVIQYQPEHNQVVVKGLPVEHMALMRDQHPDWKKLFPVFYGTYPDHSSQKPPMLGEWRVASGDLIFRPMFPFTGGREHTAAFDVGLFYKTIGKANPWNTQLLRLVFVTEAAPDLGPKARVTAIYPSSGRLPANLLKFYIQFSETMGGGPAYPHIRLLDEEGREVPDAFLETRRELWDRENKRLTLFFHPGRIKRGLALNETRGLALVPGASYRLVVGTDIRDGQGRKLYHPYEKRFTVAAPDRRSPQVNAWQLEAPPAGGTQPLTIRFDEPLDHALARRMLVVIDARGKRVAGKTSLEKDESLWIFHPVGPWRAGSYEIRADVSLEDLAGNRLLHPFDEAMDPSNKSGEDPDWVSWTFAVER